MTAAPPDDSASPEGGVPTTAPRTGRGWRVLWRTAAVLWATALLAFVLHYGQVKAQVRTVVVLADTLQVPVLEPVVGALTREPVSRDTELAGVPTTIAHPPGDGPWPTVIFITGADPKGRKQKNVVQLTDGLARAGFQAIVPDLPGLADARITTDTLDIGAEFVDAAAALDATRGHHVAIASVSTGASLAILIAQQPGADGDVASIMGIAPYADVRSVLRLMTTGTYRAPGGGTERHEPDTYLHESFTASLLLELPDPPKSLRDAVDEVADDEEDPFASLRGLDTADLTDEERGLVKLLANRDPARFDDLFERLSPHLREVIAELSPITTAGELDIPVQLATPPVDKYFPVGESEALVDALPDAQLTVTGALEHAIPSLSLDTLAEFGSLDLFVLRALQDADAA